ncbi:hypothetical protein [Oscillatoria nigro-viridis]|nr:hypothetical protein [Oscillatoria nigro-viridis]
MKTKNPKAVTLASLLAMATLSSILMPVATAKNFSSEVKPLHLENRLSQAVLPKINGYWNLQVRINGFTQPGLSNERDYLIITSLNQNESKLTGNFIAASSNACKQAQISGTVQNNQVNWVINYTGSCCKNAQMRFEGVRRSAEVIEGKLTPVGTPSNCSLWFADVTATKRRD